MITFTTGMVVGTGLALLTTAFFFPIIGYKLCYALGACTNTFDILEDFMGVEGQTRRIAKRDVQQRSEDNSMDYFMSLLKMALREYDGKSTSQREEQTQNNIMRLTPGSDHQIEKRAPLDYIEPILLMLSKAYNEFTDPELKKNFKKRRYIR